MKTDKISERLIQGNGDIPGLNMRCMKDAVRTAANQFEGYYLDYFSNFLTVEGYADYHGINDEEAKKRINLGRKIHKQHTKERAAK